MIEYDLPFEFYKRCNSCNGHGAVYLVGYKTKDLESWANRLGQKEAFEGYNHCNKCSNTGLVLDYKLEELELDV